MKRSHQSAFTLIELAIAMGIAGILAAFAVNRIDRPGLDLRSGRNALLAVLRQARAAAISKGVHFRVEIPSANELRLLRLVESNGVWGQDGPALRTVFLPGRVVFTAGINSSVEFDTRGASVGLNGPLTLSLTEMTSGHVKQVTVWPSGQIAAS